MCREDLDEPSNKTSLTFALDLGAVGTIPRPATRLQRGHEAQSFAACHAVKAIQMLQDASRKRAILPFRRLWLMR